MNRLAKFGVAFDELSDAELLAMVCDEPVVPPELGIVKVGWALSWAIGLGKCEESNPIGLWPMLARPEYDKAQPKWNLERYYSPWFWMECKRHVDLRQINNKWTVCGDGIQTYLYPYRQTAIQNACKLLGVSNPTNYTTAFAAKEQEAGWPRGWWFDEFMS